MNILDAIDDYTEKSLDQIEDGDFATPFRNRALTYFLSYTGSRICEAVSDTKDPERNGINWKDLNLNDGTVRVLGKNRKYQSMQVPSPAVAVLREYKQILNPPSESWAVFPTHHEPKLYTEGREQLSERGLDDETIDELFHENEIQEVYREKELTPPSVTNGGFRSGFWVDFVEEYDLYIDGEVPQFHAARRGIGDEIYRQDPRLAQSVLRHVNITNTHKAYSNIKASETADEVDEMIGLEEPKSMLNSSRKDIP